MKTNRYPTGRGSVGTQPLPKPFPRPNNVTRVQFPANDNFPGFPPRKPSWYGRLKPGQLGSILLTGAIFYAEYLAYRTSTGAVPGSGWVVKFDCPSVSRGDRWVAGAPSGCLNDQFPVNPSYNTPEALVAATNPNTMTLYQEYYGGITPQFPKRWRLDVSYEKIIPGVQPLPTFVRGTYVKPDALPENLPDHWVDPRVIPPGRPWPLQKPRVRHQPRPGHNPEGRNLPKDTRTIWQPRPRPRPPRKGEKERKVRASAGLRRFLGWVLSTGSEVGDFLDSLWDALPKEYQTRDATMAEKFSDLYGNLDRVDMNEAFQNLIENMHEDRITGEQFEKFNKGLEQWGLELPSLRV